MRGQSLELRYHPPTQAFLANNWCLPPRQPSVGEGTGEYRFMAQQAYTPKAAAASKGRAPARKIAMRRKSPRKPRSTQEQPSRVASASVTNGVTSDPNPGAELVFGIVAPIAADSETLERELDRSLKRTGYEVVKYHVIDLVKNLGPWKDLKGQSSLGTYEYYRSRMDDGNQLRRDIGNDAIAKLATARIHRLRGGPQAPATLGRTAFILRSLKRQEEVDTLRKVYGAFFYLIAAYSPWDKRLNALADRIAASSGKGRRRDHLDQAAELLQRDRDEMSEIHGQRVSDTFARADVFIDVSSPVPVRQQVDLFLDRVFNDPFATPTDDEYGQFIATASAARSSDLSRQVGAAILTPDGAAIATGVNEVPAPGGGQVLDPKNPKDDTRDFRMSRDASSDLKGRAFIQLWDAIQGRIAAEAQMGDKKRDKEFATAAKALTELRERALIEWEALVKNTEFAAVGEFGRSVHAEMAALMDAVRRGISVQGCTLYTTTFPCHACARHIIAAGIAKVHYVDPYPKSLADDLHMDAIGVEGPDDYPHNVPFLPYLGMAPRRYVETFIKHKTRDVRLDQGKPRNWQRDQTSEPVVGNQQLSLLHLERLERAELIQVLQRQGIDIDNPKEV